MGDRGEGIALPRIIVRFLFVCMLALSSACATATAGVASTVGTGDISFRLTWSGPADLDLRVTDPTGEQIAGTHRHSASGGILDADCNATPEQMCAHPLENVFWPKGTAPAGRYAYSVRFVNQHQAEWPVTFTVMVLRGTHIMRSEVGSFAEIPHTFQASYWGPREIDWRR